jgi:DNA polymerase
MGWGSAVRKAPAPEIERPAFPIEKVDFSRLVTLDFETHYSDEYTLRKMSTSQYIRDPRFEALLCYVQVGNKPMKVLQGPAQIARELKRIPWETHSLLCHHTQFDALILSHHYGIRPKRLYCTLSMARGLFSNQIGAGLDEVARFLGGVGKAASGTEDFKGLRWKELSKIKDKLQRAVAYCAQDGAETRRIFEEMVPLMPADEMELIHIICRMYTQPVLKLDEARCRAEWQREVDRKKKLLLSFADQAADIKLTSEDRKKLGPDATEEDRTIRKVKKLIGSNKYAELLEAAGIDPPIKISPAWVKASKEERETKQKYAYAFSKTDLDFTELLEHPDEYVRDLVEARLMVKGSGNETRAATFLKLGAGGASLPVYYKYAAAHTKRLGGGDGTNFQNLKRGSELRKTIKAPRGHVLCVCDSSQIEARVNAWLWDQHDLLDEFLAADNKTDRDPYCKQADKIYNRHIDKSTDPDERFVGKVAVLMLGYQAGWKKFQKTLALGTMGPKVFLDAETCQAAVSAYRRKNYKIQAGWKICERIIADMAAGREGSWKCISWGKDTVYLPDGMTLHYPNLRQIPDEEFDTAWVYDSKDEVVKLYGGKLDENIVQALAKIIVMGQLLAVDKLHRVVMTTHDELVACVSKRSAEKAMRDMLKIMRTPPAWCAGIPLNAEGGYAEEYSK